MGLSPKVIDMPMELFLQAAMPGKPLLQIALSASCIGIDSPVKLECPQFANANGHSLRKVQPQHINTCVAHVGMPSSFLGFILGYAGFSFAWREIIGGN